MRTLKLSIKSVWLTFPLLAVLVWLAAPPAARAASDNEVVVLFDDPGEDACNGAMAETVDLERPAEDLAQAVDVSAAACDVTFKVDVATAWSPYGEELNCVVTVVPVVPGKLLPTGTVSFIVDGRPLAEVAVKDGGATLRSRALAVGTHSVRAAYSGDANFAAASAPQLSYVGAKNVAAASIGAAR